MKKSVRVLSLIMALCCLTFVFTSCQEEDSSKEATKVSSKAASSEASKNDANSDKTIKNESSDDVQSTSSEHSFVDINVKGYGTIKVELYPEDAPITVEHFLKLVNKGFYDGISFHRIISGFMIQGGDPTGTGTGGSGEEIKGEFTANGVNNNHKHVRGTISMARNGINMDSADSQFFIVHQTSSNNSLALDGQYAAFGQVIEGMEIVDKICANTPVQDGNGTTLEKDRPIIESMKVVE